MIWDKTKIETSLNSIGRRLSDVQLESDYFTLLYDYCILLKALETIDKHAYEKLNGDLFTRELQANLCHESFLMESAEEILGKKDELIKLATYAEHYRYLHPKFTLKRRIPKEVYLEMIRAFLKNYDLKMHDLFLQLTDGNIHFASKKSETGHQNGLCFTTIEQRDAYIITDFKRMGTIATLPHELAHAHEFKAIPGNLENINWRYSTFVESFPRQIELSFTDFGINSEYSSLLFEQKRQIFDSVKASSQGLFDFLCHIEKYDFKHNCFISTNGQIVYKRYIDYLISDFFAIYIYHLSKTDITAYNDFMAKYNAQKGVSDSSIWNLFSTGELQDAFMVESRTYNNEIIRSRNRSNS